LQSSISQAKKDNIERFQKCRRKVNHNKFHSNWGKSGVINLECLMINYSAYFFRKSKKIINLKRFACSRMIWICWTQLCSKHSPLRFSIDCRKLWKSSQKIAWVKVPSTSVNRILTWQKHFSVILEGVNITRSCSKSYLLFW